MVAMRPKEKEECAKLKELDISNAPLKVTTERLILRKPTLQDAEAIFERYASDEEVCKYLGWPCNKSIDETRDFLKVSDREWEIWPAGPYLIFTFDGTLIGSTGFSFETPFRASCGYVIAKDAWGHGYATEALKAICSLAPTLGLVRLYALVYPDHKGSIRVLEKCDFAFEGILRKNSIFPNIDKCTPLDDACYSWISPSSV